MKGRNDEVNAEGDGNLVTLGRVSGLYGVKGWMKVYSFTEPRENIIKYKEWFLKRGKEWESWTVKSGKRHGKGVIVKLQGCDDRDKAAELIGADIGVQRSQFSDDLDEGQFYWTDLEGMKVVNREGVDLGYISHLFETGANDVLVVKGDRERLIPYIWQQVVLDVDLDTRVMQVDWDPDF